MIRRTGDFTANSRSDQRESGFQSGASLLLRPAASLLMILLLTVLPPNSLRAAEVQTRGLCGTCRLAVVNTGKYLYKTTAQSHETSAAEDPEPGSSAAYTTALQLGSIKSFQVLRYDSQPFRTVKAPVVKIGSHCVIFQDPAVDVGSTEATMIAYQFDDVIYPKVRNLLGQEANTGMDGDSRVYILLTDIADPEGSQWHTRGYYNPADMHAKSTDNPTSNEMEVLYMDVNPQVPASAEFFNSLAHQFAHMVLYNMDTAGGSTGVRDKLWVDEGLALLAQYACDYGHPHEYVETYLANTNTSLTMSDIREWAGEDPRAQYGASYLFALYCYEHFGADFILKWARAAEDGIKGFDAAMKKTARSDTFETVFADWMIANILDDISVKDVATYGNFGYRQLDLETEIPSSNRYTRFPLFARSLDIKECGVVYLTFSDVEASYLDILFDGVDMDNDFLIRTIAVDSNGALAVDTLAVVQNPTRLTEKKFTINVPHFGTNTMTVTLAITQLEEGGYGQGEISASMAGPRFSVFFNPILPGYVTVNLLSLVTPHAYVWQHGMTADLSIMLKDAGSDIYMGSYKIDRDYPGTATFWAEGMGPDRTTGTIKWKVDIVNVAAGDKASIYYAGVNLKTSAPAADTTILAMEPSVSLPQGILATGSGIEFSDLDPAAGAGPYTFEIEIEGAVAQDSRAGLFKVAGDGVTPLDGEICSRDGKLLFTGTAEEAGSYMVLLDSSLPQVVSATIEPESDGATYVLSATITDRGLGADTANTVISSPGTLSDIQWEKISGETWLLRARVENSSEISVTPLDLGGNSGAMARVTALAAPSGTAVRAYPCPARTSADLELITAAGLIEARVEIFDFAGHRVNSLALTAGAGSWKSTWDLTDRDGDSVANGTYLLRFRAVDTSGNETRYMSKLSVIR